MVEKRRYLSDDARAMLVLLLVLIVLNAYEHFLPPRELPSIYGTDMSHYYEFGRKEELPLYETYLLLVVSARIVCVGLIATLSGFVTHFISLRWKVSKAVWWAVAAATCAVSMVGVHMIAHGDDIPMLTLIVLAVFHVVSFAIHSWGVTPSDDKSEGAKPQP